MEPDTADITLHFTVTETKKPLERRLTAFPEGMGTMIRLSEGSSLRGTVFNLVNSIIGGGILGLPFAIEQMGVALGGVLLVITALLQDLTVWMLLVSMDETREKSYSMVGEVLFNQTVGVLVDIAVTLNNLGVLISYVVIIGDVVPPFMTHIHAPNVFQNRTCVIVFIAALVLLPLSSMRSMGALRHASFVCLLMIVLLAVTIVSMGMGWINVSKETDMPAAFFSSDTVAIIGQMPVMIFAYNCNMNVPILYGELRRQKHEAIDSKFGTKRSKMMMGTHISVVTCASIYCIVATSGYNAFRDRTAPDILTNLEAGSFSPAPYVKAAYSIVIICSYPVMAFSCIASLHRLILHGLTAFRHEPGPRMGGYALFQASSPGPSPPQSPVPSPPSSPPRSPRSIWSGSDVFASPYALPGEIHLKDSPQFAGQQRQHGLKPPPPSNRVRRTEVVCIVIATVALGVLLPDISIVFGLTGGICGAAITFIFPGLFYMRVARQVKGTSSRLLCGPWLGHVSLWLGICISVGSTAVVAWQTAMP